MPKSLNWNGFRLHRIPYFVSVTMLIVATVLFPFLAEFWIAGLLWLIIVGARALDVGRALWSVVATILILATLFTGNLYRYVEFNAGTKNAVYLLLVWIPTLATFTIALGLQKSGSGRRAAPAEQ